MQAAMVFGRIYTSKAVKGLNVNPKKTNKFIIQFFLYLE